ncbi:MAG: protein translocase subunit SecDF [Bacteroidales bacterium]|nr:protein translocase subunit SecDF [Bacteroidales bacterium]
MQNKGLIRFLTYAFLLVCLFQLTFTFATRSVERHAKNDTSAYLNQESTKQQASSVAQGDALRAQIVMDSLGVSHEAHYLDSMANEKVWLGFTYRQCQNREINLGLDLKGGMNVMMEVSTVDVVRALAGHTEDSTFNKAIALAQKNQKVTTNQNFVDLFYQAIKQIDPNVQLAPYFNTQLRDRIKMSDDNDQVVKVVKEETASAYNRTYEILRQRIDKFGVAQPTIQKLQASERILVELPGVKDPQRVRNLLQGTAQLEFWLAYECADALPYLERTNSYVASVNSDVTNTAAETADAMKADSTVADSSRTAIQNALANNAVATAGSNANETAHAEAMKGDPLFALLSPNINPETRQYAQGPVVGYAKAKDRGAIDKMIQMGIDKKIVDGRLVKFLWSAKPVSENSDVYALYAIRVTTRDGSALLDGSVITDARQDFSQVGGNEISMTMNTEGAREWKRITGENVGKCVAIVLDNLVYSAPVVNGEIAGGRSSITGQFSLEEAKDLANILKSGKLPAPAVIVQEAIVGPSLGLESIHKGLISFILAFIVVLIYMVVFYNRAGWVSVVALVANVFLLMGVLASIGSVLTMPGIAGIVLTMAMAVDGNVIIYERIKEELRNGKSMNNAVETGFHNAYSAIIDGQVTTFLLGLVLILFGSGPVQGFAVTLCIGIVTSLFTSIFITRLCIDNMLKRNRKINFSYPFSENFMRNSRLDIVGNRKTFYIIALCFIVLGIGSLGFRGLNFGIDFTGGRTYVVRFDQPVSVNEVRASLAKQFEEAPEVKTYGPSNQVKVTTKYKVQDDSDATKNEILGKLYEGTKPFFKDNLSMKDFQSTEINPLGIIQSEQVGATIANDLKRSSILAVIGGLLVIFAYIAIRFKSWRFGLGSVTALAHDTILVIGSFALLYGILPFNLEVDQSFIAAVLTVIGYSINSTVVIFDRVRENRELFPKREWKQQLNDAINSTMARTINTNGTTFFTLLMMFIFGGETIRGFLFALLVGVVCGMFSSVCIASPIVYEIFRGKEKKELAKLEAAKK